MPLEPKFCEYIWLRQTFELSHTSRAGKGMTRTFIHFDWSRGHWCVLGSTGSHQNRAAPTQCSRKASTTLCRATIDTQGASQHSRPPWVGTAHCPALIPSHRSSQQTCTGECIWFGCSGVSTNTISICTTSQELAQGQQLLSACAWDVSIAAWDAVLAGRQWRLLCRCEYLYKSYKILFWYFTLWIFYPLGSGRVCLRLLVRSSSFPLHSFRSWFSTVPWQAGSNTLLVLRQGMFPQGYFPPDQRVWFKL